MKIRLKLKTTEAALSSLISDAVFDSMQDLKGLSTSELECVRELRLTKVRGICGTWLRAPAINNPYKDPSVPKDALFVTLEFDTVACTCLVVDWRGQACGPLTEESQEEPK